MARRRVLLTVLAAASMGLLTACGSTGGTGGGSGSGSDVTASPTPTPGAAQPAGSTPLAVEGLDDETVPGDEDAVQAWAGPDTLTITSYGSSSCPNIPTILNIDESAARVDVELVTNSEGPCTADFAPTTFNLPIQQDIAGFTVYATFRADTTPSPTPG